MVVWGSLMSPPLARSLLHAGTGEHVRDQSMKRFMWIVSTNVLYTRHLSRAIHRRVSTQKLGIAGSPLATTTTMVHLSTDSPTLAFSFLLSISGFL